MAYKVSLVIKRQD